MRVIRALLWLAGGFALLVFALLTATTLSYSAVCARCLLTARGVERSVFFVPYYHRERLGVADRSIMSPGAMGDSLPRARPELFKEITGGTCAHHLVRTGFCMSTGGLVGCGSYGEDSVHLTRLALLEQLYYAYGRVPDKALAGETMRLLDEVSPLAHAQPRLTSLPVPFQAEDYPDLPESILLRGLRYLESAEEWRAVLQAVHARDGRLEFLYSPARLQARLRHPKADIRGETIKRLAKTDDPQAWEDIRECLNDKDEYVIRCAREALAHGGGTPR